MKINRNYLITVFPILFFKFTINNAIATLVDDQGFQVTTISSGQLNYKGANKGSRIALQDVVVTVAKFVINMGYYQIVVKIHGFGNGRKFIIRELTKLGLVLVYITDENSLPFNGCRSKKRRR